MMNQIVTWKVLENHYFHPFENLYQLEYLVKLCYIRVFMGFLPTHGNRGEQHEIEQIFSSLDINNNEEVWINCLQNAVLFGKR